MSLGLMFLAPTGSAVAGTRATSSVAKAAVFSPAMHLVGTLNLSSLGPPPIQGRPGRSESSGSYRVADQTLAKHRPSGTGTSPAVPSTPVTSRQVAGERGFDGLNGVQQATANGGLDLEPPDQGLCAGNGYVGEFINNAFTVYSSSGSQLLPVLPSPELFKQPSTAFFSDPRCYYDAPTGRWFLAEFIVGTVSGGKSTSPSLQFLAVSDTSDPTGSYHIWDWRTTDVGNTGCPCFGDYDELGADNNGIYITTDEFPIATAGYNGSIVYALSKELIETYANSGIPPKAFGYRLTADAFGQPYIVAPTSTPQGAAFAPNTEYFMETDGNAYADHRVEVYALTNTSELAAPGAPTLVSTVVKTERYAFPPDATQPPGYRPLGRSVQDPEGQLEADFDAMMEPTYVNGHLYGEFETATGSGNNAAGWVDVKPTLSGSTLTAALIHQGYVAPAGASTLYPYIALDQHGSGYMLFAISGKSNYPSAAYVSFGSTGPSGPVHIAAAGAGPEDSFTCYAAFVGPTYGGCRWGDYSMGVFSSGRVYMATEIVPPTSRDTLTNWGTYVWSAPPGA